MENIFEYLIPLIFIVSILSMRKKKKQKERKAEAESDRLPEQPVGTGKTNYPGMIGKLNKMLDDYYKSDLEGAPEQQTAQSWANESARMKPVYREPEPWEDEDEVLAETRVQQPVANKRREPVIEKQAAATEPVTEPPPAQPPAAEVVKKKFSIERPKPKADEVPTRAPSRRLSQGISRSKLRSAVVWSEILAPPKALRDE